MDKAAQLNNSSQTSRRRGQEFNFPGRSFPSSRSPSPNRNVKTRRAAFENNTKNTPAVKVKTQPTNALRADDSRNLSPSTRDNGDTETQIKKHLSNFTVAERAQSTDKPATGESLVQAFSRTSCDVEDCRNELASHNDKSTSLEKANRISGTSSIDRAADVRTVSGYGSVFSKPTILTENEKATSKSNDVSGTKIFSRRSRERAAVRNKRMQAQKEETIQNSDEMKTKTTSKQQYVPSYVLPVAAAFTKVQTGPVIGVCKSQTRTAAVRQTSTVLMSDSLKKTDQVKDKISPSRVNLSRRSSSDDESSTFAPKSKLPSSGKPQTSGTFDNSPEKQSSREAKRSKRRLRKAHRPTSSQDNQFSKHSSVQMASNIAQRMQFFQSSDSPQNHKHDLGESLKGNTITAPITRRSRTKHRKQAFAETEEKYSTLPANFSPSDVRDSMSNNSQFKSGDLRFQQANTPNSKPNQTRTLNELMITPKQILDSEDDKKKSYVLRPNSVNQSKSFLSNQHSRSSSTGIDRSDIAGGSLESIDKTPPLPPQTKSKQVESLRNLFNSEDVPKIEFGQAYNKQEHQQRSTIISKNVTEGQKSNKDQTVHSQPMLKAVKLSEHYWPKDEATEKLFIRNSTHSSESNKKASHTLETVDEMSDLSSQAVTDSKKTVLPGSSQLPCSPKETNLNDPVVISEIERWSERSKKHSLSSVASQNQDLRKGTSSATSKALQTASHYDVIPERTARSQSLDSGADAYLRDKLPSSQWSFDDPDSKLKAYENSLTDADTVVDYLPLTEEKSEVNSAGSVDFNPVNEEVVNFAPMRTIYLNGAPLYTPPKFSESNEHLQKSSIVSSSQLDYNKSKDGKAHQSQLNRSKPIDVNSTRFTNLKPTAQSESNTTQPISTSTRKNSVVSRSAALPRSSVPSSQDIDASDTDEGCVIEEAAGPESAAMKAALLKHPSLAQGSSSRTEDRSELGVCGTPNSRRRRKFSAAGQNNSDSSNTSNNSESSRSLSDPIPNRKKSINGADEETGPVDSNFQYPLKPGGCVPKEELELNNSTSDLSGFSENNSIQSDFNEMETFGDEPHAIEQALAAYDAKKLSNPAQKRSFGNPIPSAIVDSSLLNKKAEAEVDKTLVCSSSSEAVSSESVDHDDESSQNRRYSSSHRSNSNRSWSSNDDTVSNMTQSLEEMSHSMYADNRVSRSPRLTRKLKSARARRRAKNSRNRDDNLQRTSSETTDSSSTASESDPVVDSALEQAQEQFQTIYDSMSSRDADNSSAITTAVAHSRSCSAPATGDDLDSLLSRKASGRGRRPGIVQAPSLSDVLQKDPALQMNLAATKPLSSSTDGLLAATFPRTVASRGLDYQKYGKGREKLDMRRHVVGNLLETEASYVKSLRILFETYYQPLKRPENHSICEPRLVNEIFFQIPQILQHHEKFYANVLDCVDHWEHENIKMGEVFIQSFNKDKLLESYTNYIKNYLNAKEAVNVAIAAKSAFKIFLEQCQRENKEKQGLSDLMIKPVQRIPRYELIIKDLLKHTPEGHPDRHSLLMAQQEIHDLSVQMNRGEKVAEAADRQARLLQEIEQLIEGNVDIAGTSKRKFLHQDICSELKNGSKKERSLWLFNDMLMCTTSKKSGRVSSLRRSSMNLFSMSPDRVMVDFTCRYKFIWKFPLDDVDLLKGSIGTSQQPHERLLQQLQADQESIHKIEVLAEKITLPHLQLDEAIKDLLEVSSKRISEKQQLSRQSLSLPGRLEIGIPTPDGMKVFQFEFTTEDGKAQFEHLFWNAKKNFTSYKRKWEPTFVKAIPISKTRNGMQFSCAAPNIDTSPGAREVWVCNTDGYVGQICILSLEPEPVQTQCLTVCNAKICCIEQVPTWGGKPLSAISVQRDISAPKQGIAQTRRRSSTNNLAKEIIAWDTDESEEEDNSPVSTISNSSQNCTIPSIDSSNVVREVPSSDAFGNRVPNSGMREIIGSGAYKKDSDGSTLHGSLDDLLSDNSSSINGGRALPSNGSMWLGTEDGKINIYSTTEALRTSNHPDQLNHSASVHCILHHEGQVFVALSNGDLVIYHRNPSNGKWELNNKKCMTGTSPNSPITKMVVVNDKELWCGCQNQIGILDVKNHNLQALFPVTQDNKKQIYCMVCFGFGVWVALDKRPQIKLFHSVTHALITEVDVSHPVSKMLASADAIIRQHKAACLRITSLLVCNNLVWVGTSAGVVLTMALPTINVATTSLPLPVMPQGLPYGHTGHVRFLTSVETLDQGSSEQLSTQQRQHATSTPAKTNTLVISGGDGYEDFRMNSANEVAGREDSTNHLLVWKV